MPVNLEAGWREASMAGIVTDAGNSVEYLTGGWRTLKPVRDEERCTHCMICWVYCPDSCILVEDGRVVGFDYDHCKGCGICAAECPVKVDKHAHTGQAGKVIQMVLETS
ncbi:MAG TPA: ferredoxin [Anaerolineae bacterium]|nr:ferredoxin [Anaerolineae bacterium]HIP95749.1 ferredoxin [Anaerolineae bacterium]